MRIAERARLRRLQRDGIISRLNSVDSVASAPPTLLKLPVSISDGTDLSFCASPSPGSPGPSPSLIILPPRSPSPKRAPPVSRLKLLNSSECVLGPVVNQCYTEEPTPPPKSVRQVASRMQRAISRAALKQSDQAAPSALLEPIVPISGVPSTSRISRRGSLYPYRISLFDLPTEMVLEVLGEFHITELTQMRAVCFTFAALIDEMARRLYQSMFGTLIDPRDLNTCWAALLRESMKRLSRNFDAQPRWPEDAAWIACRGMELMWANLHILSNFSFPLDKTAQGAVAVARNRLAGPLFEKYMTAMARHLGMLQWGDILASALVGGNLALAEKVAADHAEIHPDTTTVSLEAIRGLTLPIFCGVPRIRLLGSVLYCHRSDEEALRAMKWLLGWKASRPGYHYYINYIGTVLPLLDAFIRLNSSRACLSLLMEAGGRPPIREFISSLPSERTVESYFWLVECPIWTWEELFEETAQSGSAALFSLLLKRAPNYRPGSRLLRSALIASNRPIAELLMPLVKVHDRPLIGAAIHGELYDLAFSLALKGAKQTELFRGRPLVLLLAGKAFMPSDARALLDLLLSPHDAHTQSWLAAALNVPYDDELPLCAAISGDDAMYKVTRLLKAGARPDHSDGAGNTPLLLALKSGAAKRPVAELLLQHGASINARNAADESPLSVALSLGDVALLTRLIDAGALPHMSVKGATLLHTWLAEHNLEWNATRAIVDALVPHCIAVDARTHDGGDTLLHYAVKYRRRQAIQALLLRGASPDLPNASNQTPLQLAQRMRQSPQIIAMLKEHSKKSSSVCVVS